MRPVQTPPASKRQHPLSYYLFMSGFGHRAANSELMRLDSPEKKRWDSWLSEAL
jgi:hypothetical protein